MRPETWWKVAVAAFALGFSVLMALVVMVPRALASPPSGGLPYECVVRDGGDCLAYRFRDGPRVCYWLARRVYGGSSPAISCVVSP